MQIAQSLVYYIKPYERINNYNKSLRGLPGTFVNDGGVNLSDILADMK